MKLHELRPAPGSRRSRKRIGRGISAGQGKTSGRGQKGAGAREGAKTPRGFEGGQMKITMRLPKLRGFTNRWRAEYTAINVSKLNRFPSAAIVDGAALAQAGLVTRPGERVKLLAAGRLQGGADRPGPARLAPPRCAPSRPPADGSSCSRPARPRPSRPLQRPRPPQAPAANTGDDSGGGARGVNLLQALAQALRIPELRKKLRLHPAAPARLPGAGLDLDPGRQRDRAQRPLHQQHPARSAQPLQRQRAGPLHHRRPRAQPLHQRHHHHAADDRGLGPAQGAVQGGGDRAQADHPLHPLADRPARRPPGLRLHGPLHQPERDPGGRDHPQPRPSPRPSPSSSPSPPAPSSPCGWAS